MFITVQSYYNLGVVPFSSHTTLSRYSSRIYCICPVAVGVQFCYLVATINTRYHEDRKSPATFYWKTSWPQTPVVQRSLGLPSLELRRLYFDVSYCYKIVFGLVKLNFSEYFDFSFAPTKGHLYKLYNIDVTASELAYSQTELLTCGTRIYQYLPVCLSFNGLAPAILISF